MESADSVVSAAMHGSWSGGLQVSGDETDVKIIFKPRSSMGFIEKLTWLFSAKSFDRNKVRETLEKLSTPQAVLERCIRRKVYGETKNPRAVCERVNAVMKQIFQGRVDPEKEKILIDHFPDPLLQELPTETDAQSALYYSEKALSEYRKIIHKASKSTNDPLELLYEVFSILIPVGLDSRCNRATYAAILVYLDSGRSLNELSARLAHLFPNEFHSKTFFSNLCLQGFLERQIPLKYLPQLIHLEASQADSQRSLLLNRLQSVSEKVEDEEGKLFLLEMVCQISDPGYSWDEGYCSQVRAKTTFLCDCALHAEKNLTVSDLLEYNKAFECSSNPKGTRIVY